VPTETKIQRRRRIAAESGVTSSRADFAHICKRHPERVGIVTEGDSWFAYPRKWIAFGGDSNVVHHIEYLVEDTNTTNLLRLACNGDEAVNMMSGRQKEIFEKVLRTSSSHIKLILFSGGGNDIVGKRDMLGLLNRYKLGYSPKQCINTEQLANKLRAIMLAYEQLIELRNTHAPHAKIITHSYDIAKPSEEGATFFWGLIKTKPWISPYLNERRIPEHLHQGIVEILLGTFKDQLEALTQMPRHKGSIHMVNTQGILRPGHKDDWVNEIHPTEEGFKKITKPIYKLMRKLEPSLPSWQD
jgi:hypothetical protein